jgi:hypothetical protein
MEWEIQAYHKNNKKNTVSLGQLKKMQKFLEVQFYTRGEKIKEKSLSNNNNGSAQLVAYKNYHRYKICIYI